LNSLEDEERDEEEGEGEEEDEREGDESYCRICLRAFNGIF